MSFLIILIPFVVALVACRQFSFTAFFGHYKTGLNGKPVDDHFPLYVSAHFIALRVEMFGIVFSAVGGLGCVIFFSNASYAGTVRVIFILSIIAVVVAILAAIFCRLVVLFRGLLYTLTYCVFLSILLKCDVDEEEDRETAFEMAGFAWFVMENIFTLREHIKMLSEVPRGLKSSPDIDGFLNQIFSLFCEYLEDVRDECKRSFISSQPPYQMVLDLKSQI